jgi:hypothetical protein
VCAQDKDAAGGVVRHGIDDADVPVGDARVDHFKARRDVRSRRQHRLGRNAGTLERALQDERDLRFRARLDHAIADAHGAPVRDLHAIGEEAEVRLMHAEHVLHGAAGDADLLTDHALTGALAPCQDPE